jgi:hypothetical protein
LPVLPVDQVKRQPEALRPGELIGAGEIVNTLHHAPGHTSRDDGTLGAVGTSGSPVKDLLNRPSDLKPLSLSQRALVVSQKVVQLPEGLIVIDHTLTAEIRDPVGRCSNQRIVK